ncbi:MAG: hypothetical protein ACI9IT_001463 [Glaciecola sp.]|jgi:hypothetical protein
MCLKKTAAKNRVLRSLLYKYGVHLLLLSVIAIWLSDVFYIENIQKDKNQKLEKTIQKKNDELAIKWVEKSTSDSVVMTKKLPLLASVTMPRAPLINASLPVDMNVMEGAPLISITSDRAYKKQEAGRETSKINLSGVFTPKIHKGTQQTILENLLLEPTVMQVKNVMNQLTVLNSRDIKFLLPSGNSAKEAFLNHMYRCENMQFGSLTKTSPYQLTLLSGESSRAVLFQPSEFLRVAHDYLSRYETNLLTLYGQGNRPVRIFPLSLDVNLATKIAQVTGENQLNSFSARYFLHGSQIGLTEIVLNEQEVTQNWIISAKGCY